MEQKTHPAHENGIKIPTVGRQVHYFPNGKDEVAQANNAEVLPATVIQPFGTRLNLQVMTMNHDAHTVLRSSVPHKSMVPESNPKAFAYWDWPEIK